MLTWKEFRIERQGRRGFLLVLPCFADDEHPDSVQRMNRFYEEAAENLYQAALDAVGRDARRVYYRCLPEVTAENGTITVTLRLMLNVSGERTRAKALTHVWRDGEVISRSCTPLL